MKTSVIIPTKGRPLQLRCCLMGLKATTREHDVEVIVVVDQCKVSAAMLKTIPDIKVINNAEHKGAVACWNQGYSVAKGAAIVLGADDVVFLNGWLDAALETLEELDGWGMVGFNDGITPAHAFAPHFLMTRDFINRYMAGYFVPPCYKHHYIDLEATARAKRAGRYKWCEDARIEHRHHAHKLAVMDDVYKLANAYLEADKAVYQARLAAGFPNDYKPL